MAEALTTATRSWLIEPLSADRLEALAAFQQRAYADQFHAQWFVDRGEVLRRLTWQCLESPGARGAQLPVWVLRQDDAIVGQLVLMPVQVKVGQRWLRGGWCQDFVIAPEYRHRGAGVLLLREVLRAVESEMAVVLAGGTNRESYPMFCAAGFQDVGTLPRSVGFTRLTRLLSPGLAARSPDVTVQTIDPVDGRLDDWWRGREDAYTGLVRRDAAWRRWRFAQHPHWSYRTIMALRRGQPEGYAVMRKGHTQVWGAAVPTCRIVEFAATPAAASALLAETGRWAVERHCQLIRGDLLDARLRPSMFRRHGLWPASSANCVLIRTHELAAAHPPSPEAPPLGGEEGEARVLLRSRADKATAKQNTASERFRPTGVQEGATGPASLKLRRVLRSSKSEGDLPVGLYGGQGLQGWWLSGADSDFDLYEPGGPAR